MISVTVSGSFHRHMNAIAEVVEDFTDRGLRVLSPEDPRVVDRYEDFLFVASDRVRSIRLVQDRHLEAIRASDFLWIVSPDGYIGQSASMEIGFAVAAGIPIFSLTRPTDLTFRRYVEVVPDPERAIENCRPFAGNFESRSGLLINPHDSIERAHDVLVQLDDALSGSHASLPQDAEYVVQAGQKEIRRLMSVTSHGANKSR